MSIFSYPISQLASPARMGTPLTEEEVHKDGTVSEQMVIRPSRLMMESSPLSKRLFGWRERLLPATHNNVFLLIDTLDEKEARRALDRLWKKRLLTEGAMKLANALE